VTDTRTEVEAASVRTLAAMLHEEAPVPTWVACDMLQDAGAEDRTDAVFHLFRAAAEYLDTELGPEPAMQPADFFNDGRQAIQAAWTDAKLCCAQIRGQGIPAGARDLFDEHLGAVPGLSGVGLSWTVRRMALESWRDKLARVTDLLTALQLHEGSP